MVAAILHRFLGALVLAPSFGFGGRAWNARA